MPASFMWRDPRFGGLDLFRAELTDYAYSRHFHETYVVAVGRETGYRFACERGTFTAPPGSIVLINPGEVHDGRSVDGKRLDYRSMYPSAALMEDAARGLGGARGALPVFPKRVVHDSGLAELLTRAHVGLERAKASLGAQELLVRALTVLVERHAERLGAVREVSEAPRGVARAREYLEAHATNAAVSLEVLAGVAGLSPYHLVRVFNRTLGLPPHQYLMNVRVQRAQGMLSRGGGIARVAVACGFSDQSHLNRCFKRVLGVTPGRYRSKFVQDDGRTGL